MKTFKTQFGIMISTEHKQYQPHQEATTSLQTIPRLTHLAKPLE
jgi:hypothetical protein